MGVGYPLDLVVCVALGVDMFDCVYPTRTARFGVALTDAGTMKIKVSCVCVHHMCVCKESVCVLCNKRRDDIHLFDNTIFFIHYRPILSALLFNTLKKICFNMYIVLMIFFFLFSFSFIIILFFNILKQNKEYASDFKSIDSACKCLCCSKYNRSDLHALFKFNDSVACQLLTIHNIAYMLNLCRRMRFNIMQHSYSHFVRQFLEIHFINGNSNFKISNHEEDKLDGGKLEESVNIDSQVEDSNKLSSCSSSPTFTVTNGSTSTITVPLWVEEALCAAQCDWRNA